MAGNLSDHGGIANGSEGIVTVYFGKAIWIAWTGDLPARGLLVFLAALEATSLANVWVQVALACTSVAEPECQPWRT